jgi:hypothetical protein
MAALVCSLPPQIHAIGGIGHRQPKMPWLLVASPGAPLGIGASGALNVRRKPSLVNRMSKEAEK